MVINLVITLGIKVKVKVKFSLGLAKPHAMKTYTLLNYASSQEDALGDWRCGSTNF
jgi:hypothetical protein